ncbi:proline dehydrogenase [Lentibacillus cibarius]|uniref:proline dehydrogenase n=1 Tax=Lentibacillus cibarius TaxID=2583219 RepID=A0A549YEX1_9BACI|nr:proline dehydrogenase family protein [Lentibacillus cibarius]TMN21532.1 proline dehydrogenase [Lentibacillus cibarius]TRM10432.1 proline dehydrogenase [Lentibacillus cibarius]
MTNVTRDFFIGLSNNHFLNAQAKKWGFVLGADKFVAGTTVQSVVEAVKSLNEKGISCTLDNLGEFVSDKQEATEAKNQIIHILEAIHSQQLDCHLSVKLTQLGLDIDQSYCIENMKEILDTAAAYNIFVNIDMEDYTHYEQTLEVLEVLRERYDNVGTVIQSYLYRAQEDMDKLKDVRIRLVKGAYKEGEDVAYPNKQDIDLNFIRLAKQRLLGNTFTSIATHDHHIIEELKTFVAENAISTDVFEFQMLYGFRNDMQDKLAEEGYNFCTYIPFGDDWFGYFMRRLAERPQNLNLVMKDALYTEDNKLKKGPVIAGGAIAAASALAIWRRKNKDKVSS